MRNSFVRDIFEPSSETFAKKGRDLKQTEKAESAIRQLEASLDDYHFEVAVRADVQNRLVNSLPV